ncbi:MAG: hypothetical protein HZA32_05895 [Opitutae bacterium]|nr:hypothetical protein [Opitutae bacterium]
MNFTPASPGSVMVFIGILLAVVCAFLVAARRAYAAERGRFLVVVFGAGAWIGLMAAAVASGRMWELPLHGLPFFFGGVLAVSVGAGFSPLGRRMADAVPLAALVAFQGFRLPLELVLHTWAGQGTIPATMTWTGQNWDVVTGAVALLAAPFVARRRGVAWGVNLVGWALLINVGRVAVLSSPLPFGWGQQPTLLLAFHLPYALIGPVCVGGALFGHVVLTRALLRGK